MLKVSVVLLARETTSYAESTGASGAILGCRAQSAHPDYTPAARRGAKSQNLSVQPATAEVAARAGIQEAEDSRTEIRHQGQVWRSGRARHRVPVTGPTLRCGATRMGDPSSRASSRTPSESD